jgi:hypothetical protein
MFILNLFLFFLQAIRTLDSKLLQKVIKFGERHDLVTPELKRAQLAVVVADNLRQAISSMDRETIEKNMDQVLSLTLYVWFCT